MSEVITKVEIDLNENLETILRTQIHNLVNQFVYNQAQIQIEGGNTVISTLPVEIEVRAIVRVPIVRNTSLKTREIQIVEL